MPIAVRCPNCSHSGSVPDNTVRVNCSRCGKQFSPTRASPPPPPRSRRPVSVADLYELEREFFDVERDLRDAQSQLNAARNHLEAHPVSDSAIEQFRKAKRQEHDHRNAYDAERNNLDDINREIARRDAISKRIRRRIEQGRFFYGAVGQGLVCVGEIAVVFLLSSAFLLKIPPAIWGILSTVLALGVVAITLFAFSLKRPAHDEYIASLLNDLESAEDAARSIEPDRPLRS